MKSAFVTVLCMTAFFSSTAMAMSRGHRLPDPDVVAQVDLDRYVGKWFEVAHSPNFFQRKCVSSTAEYSVLTPGQISVYNTCYKANGSTSDISGVATVVDPSVPAKLRVRFSFFQKGDYWITELDPDYQWAVVSSPGKRFTFILSRTAPLARETLEQILTTLKSKGFETESLVFDEY